MVTGPSPANNNGRKTRRYSSTGRRVPVWSLKFQWSSDSSTDGSIYAGNADGAAASDAASGRRGGGRKKKADSLRFRLMQLARMKFMRRKATQAKLQPPALDGPLLLHAEESPGGHSIRFYWSGGADVKAKATRLFSAKLSDAASSPRPH